MPTQRFGVLMLFLLIAALIGDLILLPAILAGPLGKYFCNIKAGRKSAEMEENLADDQEDFEREQDAHSSQMEGSKSATTPPHMIKFQDSAFKDSTHPENRKSKGTG